MKCRYQWQEITEERTSEILQGKKNNKNCLTVLSYIKGRIFENRNGANPFFVASSLNEGEKLPRDLSMWGFIVVREQEIHAHVLNETDTLKSSNQLLVMH